MLANYVLVDGYMVRRVERPRLNVEPKKNDRRPREKQCKPAGPKPKSWWMRSLREPRRWKNERGQRRAPKAVPEHGCQKRSHSNRTDRDHVNSGARCGSDHKDDEGLPNVLAVWSALRDRFRQTCGGQSKHVNTRAALPRGSAPCDLIIFLYLSSSVAIDSASCCPRTPAGATISLSGWSLMMRSSILFTNFGEWLFSICWRPG